MTYTVLARKYRPQSFEDMVGQAHVTKTLSHALSDNRVAHAFLFTGARGIGKTTTARILAKTLNCEKGVSPTPCNQCTACEQITEGRDLDVMEIDGASNNSVDDVRRLQQTVPYPPVRDRFKVIIIDEVHMLSTSAFNALLKTLEEPPPHIKFIFATTEAQKVPVTVRSRCQRYDYRLIPEALIRKKLEEILAIEKVKADEASLNLVTREAGGSMRDALTLVDQLLAHNSSELKVEVVSQVLGVADTRHIKQLILALTSKNAKTVLELCRAMNEVNVEPTQILSKLTSAHRDLLVFQATNDHTLVKTELQSLCQTLSAEISALDLHRSFRELVDLSQRVTRSAMPQAEMEVGLLRLVALPHLADLQTLMHELKSLQQESSTLASLPAKPRPAKTAAEMPSSLTPNTTVTNATTTHATKTTPIQAPVAKAPAVQAKAEPAAQAQTMPTPVAQPPLPTPTQTAPTLGDASPAWHAIVSHISQANPALGAVLEHAKIETCTTKELSLCYPEDSFYAKQSDSRDARHILSEALKQVFQAPQAKPVINVRSSSDYHAESSTSESLAAQRHTAQEQEQAMRKEQALSHPNIELAKEIFPEHAKKMDVQLTPVVNTPKS